MTVWVLLSQALICIGAQTNCQPALVGKLSTPTPVGTYTAVLANTDAAGYNGRILAFAKDRHGAAYAIHQTWTLVPSERRAWRLAHGTAGERHISHGCINIAPALFDQLAGYGEVKLIVRE